MEAIEHPLWYIITTAEVKLPNHYDRLKSGMGCIGPFLTGEDAIAASLLVKNIRFPLVVKKTTANGLFRWNDGELMQIGDPTAWTGDAQQTVSMCDEQLKIRCYGHGPLPS